MKIKPNQLKAIWMYRLSLRGLSYIEISEASNEPLGDVPKKILLGERFSSLEEVVNLKLEILYEKY